MNRAAILDAARQAVMVDRAATHGDAEDTFASIAAVWSARLGVTVTPAQAAIMLIDLKTCRAWSNPSHGDNWVDMAGYAACGGELATVKGKPELSMEELLYGVAAPARSCQCGATPGMFHAPFCPNAGRMA